jgi:hypothetical protein
VQLLYTSLDLLGLAGEHFRKLKKHLKPKFQPSIASNLPKTSFRFLTFWKKKSNILRLFSINLEILYNISKIQLPSFSGRWDMVIWILSVCFSRNFSLAKSVHFWLKVLVKIPTKVYTKFFFLSSFIRPVKQAQIFSFWKNIQNTEKFRLFWPFFRPLRRGHQHSNFYKVVEQKWFLISFNFRFLLAPAWITLFFDNLARHPMNFNFSLFDFKVIYQIQPRNPMKSFIFLVFSLVRDQAWNFRQF